MNPFEDLKKIDFVDSYHITEDLRTTILNNRENFINQFFLNASPDVLLLAITPDNINNTFSVRDTRPRVVIAVTYDMFYNEINIYNHYGNPIEGMLIYTAIKCDRTDLFDLLLDIGADINYIRFDNEQGKSTFLMTLLCFCCKSDNPYFMEKLLQFGVDPNYVPGVEFMDHFPDYTKDEIFLDYQYTPKHPISIAGYYGNFSYIDKLIGYGADVNFDNGNMFATPLFGVLQGILRSRVTQRIFPSHTYNNHKTILIDFLEKGVYLDRSIHPYLAFIIGSYKSIDTFPLVKILLEYCIDPNMYIYKISGNLISPGTYPEFYEYPKNKGNLRDKYKYTPLDLSFKTYGNNKVDKLLQIILLVTADINQTYRRKKMTNSSNENIRKYVDLFLDKSDQN